MHFEPGTKNSLIFESSDAYNNPYQGSDPRWLFVCTAGLLRSPTGARLATLHNINSRSCGVDLDYALVPITANLILWAQEIIFVEPWCYDEAMRTFQNEAQLKYYLMTRSKVLDIPDKYEYMHPELIELFNQNITWP